MDAEGGCWTEQEIRRSRRDLVPLIESGQALLFEAKGIRYVPRWQFRGGELLPGFSEVRGALKEAGYASSWDQLLYFLAPRLPLNDRSPLKAIQDGDIAIAVQAVLQFSEQGAE